MEYPKDLPTQFQNFDWIPGVKDNKTIARFGGSVNLADYCPYIQEFTWKSNDIVVRGSQCQFPENNPSPEKNFALETYGNHSKCFNHNHQQWEERTCQQVRQWQHWGSGCYEYSCKDGRLNLHVWKVNGNQSDRITYPCLFKGQEIKIVLFANEWLHIGTVVCPSCQQLCPVDTETGKAFKCRSDISKNKVSSFLSDTKAYYRDVITCSSSSSMRNVLLQSSVILFIIVGVSLSSWLSSTSSRYSQYFLLKAS